MIALGPFELHRPLGQGGMGEVWAAVHQRAERPVAVKLLTVEGARDPSFQAAFRNEVRAAAALDHPSVVMVYEYGEAHEVVEQASAGRIAAGTPYLAMELVDGGTLHQHVGRLDWPRLRAVILNLLDALAHAHARGVIHRDLKPSNVLVSERDGRFGVKLTDFGLAHAVEGHLASAERPFYGGTPSFMAPEQFGGQWRDYGPWTDLYGFGCLVFALVRGSPPFGPSAAYEEKQRQHLYEEVPPLHPPFPVPAGFEGWLRRLLEKDPGRRFRRAADAAWAFSHLGEPEVVSAMPAEAASVADTLILGDDVRAEAVADTRVYPPLGDATTLIALPLEETGEAGLTIAAEPDAQPPLPADWRAESVERARLAGAGLGLFGLRSVPLVGREAERDTLWAALRRVREAGRARLVALTGPAGCGKSHIAKWLTERAHEVGGAIVLRASHGPIPGPSHGLGPMVGSYLRCQGLSRSEVLERVEQIFRSHGVDHADEWMALTEVIAPAHGDETGAIRFGSALERFVTVRRLVQALCVERPVVLWVEDVQWGLDALRFVEYLLDRQRLHAIPVLVLVTATEEGLAERLDEATLLAELLEREEATRIEVAPLPQPRLHDLIEELLGLDGDLADRVVERSDGNPLFAVQLVGDWVERALLEVGEEGYRLGPEAPAELPDHVGALWRSRVERMLARRSPAEERALELAAALGNEIDPDEWLAVCERSTLGGPDRSSQPADPSEELLEDLLNQGLAHAGEGGPARGWSFVHALLRECVEQRAYEAGRLEDLHRVCAEVLADRAAHWSGTTSWDGAAGLSGGAPAGLSERLGRHLLASGQGEAALRPLLEAANARYQLGDYAAGDALLDRRDTAMATLGLPPSDVRWGEGWLVRHDVCRGRGDYEAAEQWLSRVEQAASVHGWDAVAATALCHRGKLARLAGNLDEALTALRSVERLADLLGDRALRARARWEAGRALADHGEFERGERAIRAALDDYESLEDPVGCARAWQSLGEVAKEAGRHGEAAVLLRRAEALFEECGNRWGMGSAINSRGDVARYRGDLDEAAALYRRARGLLRAIGSGGWMFPDFNLGLVHLARGDAAGARGPLDRGMEAFVRQGNRSAIVGAHLGLAACAALQSRWLEWDEHMHEARALIRDTSVVDEDNARTALLAGHAARAAGQPERARVAYQLSRRQWLGLRRTGEVATVDALLRALDDEET